VSAAATRAPEAAARTVIVTGASRGLGLGIARRLAAAGHQVVTVARRESEALAALTAAPRDGTAGAVHFRAFDLAQHTALSGFVRELRAEFGPFYGLVNNAGIGTSGILATMPEERIAELVLVNTLSPLLLTRQVVRSMMARRSGRIVSIASIVASTGYSGLVAYAATKASLVGMTRSLAREVGSLGITVNAVAPGFVSTEMTSELTEAQRDQVARRAALRRLARVEEVAEAVAFLMGEGAAGITGTVLTVDAGGTA
jgi:3-oxoacyl-[acyl-carrier protein] reductase